MMIHYLAILARIMIGPFPVPGVFALQYVKRGTTVSFLTMLAFNRVIKTLFQRMTAVPEKTVMISMGVVTFLCTSTHIVQEVLTRQSRGLQHFPRFHLSVVLSNGGPCS